MKRDDYYMIVFYFILSTALIVLSGCDKYSRYKFATFFFTGVPHPDGHIDYSAAEETQSISGAEPKKKRRGKASSHGPYAAKRCYLCHETSTTRGLVKGDIKQTGSTAPKARFDTGLPGRLLAPPREICFECHPSKSTESAFQQNLWIHGPVADGMCIICHSPHASPNPFMLREGSSTQMCRRCHAEGFIVPSEDHLKGEECTQCHNAHMGKTRFLLKQDYTEIF